MFDDFGFITTLIAIVAFLFARKARNEVRVLNARLNAFEAAAAAAPITAAPATPRKTDAQDVAAVPATSRVADSAPTRQPDAPEASAAKPTITSVPAAATTAPPSGPGFEERIGTRWVVWVGGLTLALGGFFMVRYSIEAGLLGPGVRVLLGGLFALALLLAGEWSRRRESLSTIAPLPIANIPAILTAAGTATAFATVYAAYALYDFLVPATAFILLGIVAMATMAAALLHGPALAGLGVAAGFVALVFLEWAVRGNPDMLVLPGGPLAGIGASPIEGSVTLHLVSAAIFAAGFGVLGFLAQGRSVSAIIPVIWAGAATFVPPALLVALYARIAHLDRSIPFAILAVLIAAAFAAATEMLGKRETRPGLAIATALFATGTLGALALALTFALEKGWLTIALSLMAWGTAWISMQRPIPFLRWLAAILAAIVVARMAWEPRVVGDLVGTTPVFNWLLWGYGVPALSFWAASILLRRRGDDAPLRMVESAAILFTVLLAFLQIRHFIHGGDVYRDTAGLVEVGLQVCVALAMAIGLERLRIRTGGIVHNVSALLLTLFAGAATVGGLLLWENPMLRTHDVGGLVFNDLLLGYAIPAVLALLLSYAVAGRRVAKWANTIAGFALVLALAYVSLQVRRFYHGPVLSRGITSDAEQYTYSLAWLAFGVVLLGVGVMFNSQRARLASAIVIALTIVKAFLIDMSVLTGVYRALSFMCLGLVLVAIGWLYQRILFSRRIAPPAAPIAEA